MISAQLAASKNWLEPKALQDMRALPVSREEEGGEKKKNEGERKG